MFEDYTYEHLLEDVLDNAPEDIDTRPGSIFYDAVSGILLKVAKFYTDIDLIAEMTSVVTASGEALDTRAGEYGIARLGATAAKYYVNFEGVNPATGERFFADGLYFLLQYDDENGVYYLGAEEKGSGGNNIYSGTAAVPVNNIANLVSATFGMIYVRGSDAESDESLRKRVREKIAGPAENGNKQHYKTWCESRDGVGRARIFPLWNGPNTVKGVLIDTQGRSCSAAKVAEVQEYIDPAEKGYMAVVDGRTYVVGDGLGEGVANLGAHFTAAGAVELVVDVRFAAELASGATAEMAASEATVAVEEYLKGLVLDVENEADVIVRISAVGAILSSLPSILDYRDLTLNGVDGNIRPNVDEVPVLGEVIVL